MNLRYIDWIWRVRGSFALPDGQSADAALDRLVPLFLQPGTSHERSADTLTFRKRGQASQDKMAVFDDGVLRIEPGETGRILRYDMMSRALLFCFLAPFLFLAFAQLAITFGKLPKPPEAASTAGKAAAGKKPVAKDDVPPMNPIDKALGAPEPEKKDPKKDKKKKKEKKPSPKPAYILAGMFAVLYVIGRLLEAWLVRNLFRKQLHGA